MKFNKILSVASLMCVFALTTPVLAGCGSSRSDSDAIYICVYDGGYGTAWIESLAEQYSELTGVRVVAEADESILDRIEDAVSHGSDYDIYMSHDINWQAYAAQGWLEPLDDIYETEVEGTGKTFAERNLEQNLEYSRTTGDDGQEHYYKVCYTQGCGGIVYNIDMFEKYGWEVPTTYEELTELCKTIVDANIIDDDRNVLVPFTWSGTDRQYYWDYIVFEWWAQLAGVDKVEAICRYYGPEDVNNYDPNDLDALTNVYNGYELYNPDTYYKEFIEAYSLWYDLIAEHPEYSTSGAQGYNLMSAQSEFVNQRAAMIPYAQWAKYEISSVAEDGEIPFNIGFMNTPTAPNAKEEGPFNYLVGYGDSMIIPSNAYNVEGAKDFLLFMATYDACYTFVDKAEGAFLAFDYSDVDISGLTETDTYTKSVYDKLTQSTSFTVASTNPITVWTSNKVMPWVNNDYYYALALSNNANDKASAAPAAVGAKMYADANAGWQGWCMSAGL
ncbi:MAG: extracellular solute-binding protein [Coprobacillus sp.]|nr:extracellular solute-binding protein [Coprobacillus sp.]